MALGLMLFPAGCADDNTAQPVDKLCDGASGFGARISGTTTPVDMCVPDDQVTTTLSQAEDRYWVESVFMTDSVDVEIDISFSVHSNLPLQLNMHSDTTTALADPNGVLFRYLESEPGGRAFTPTRVIGVFRLTFSDAKVAVATFKDVVIDVEESPGGAAGSRTISEGFVAVTPDP